MKPRLDASDFNVMGGIQSGLDPPEGTATLSTRHEKQRPPLVLAFLLGWLGSTLFPSVTCWMDQRELCLTPPGSATLGTI